MTSYENGIGYNPVTGGGMLFAGDARAVAAERALSAAVSRAAREIGCQVEVVAGVALLAAGEVPRSPNSLPTAALTLPS